MNELQLKFQQFMFIETQPYMLMQSYISYFTIYILYFTI